MKISLIPIPVLVRHLRSDWLACVICMLILLTVLPSASGQGMQQVLRLDSGLEFEGSVSGVQQIVEGNNVFAPYGAPIVRIDDGLRDVFVGFKRVVNLGDSARNESEIAIFQRPYPGSEGHGTIIQTGPFNMDGHRELVIGVAGRPPMTYIQGITTITPRWCEVQTLVGNKDVPMKQWKMRIGTGTLPPEITRNLLRQQIRDTGSSSEFLKIADFFLQTGQFNIAADELRYVQERFPDLAERVQDDRILIRQAFANQILGEVRLRMAAGQTKLAMDFANAFNKDGIAGETLAEFQDIAQQAIDRQNKLDQTRTKIGELIAIVKNVDANQSAAIKRLQNELETELNLENAPRLDAFLLRADDATTPAPQKIALAISGWLLGSNNATENLGIAEDMFTVRDLAIEYLRSKDEMDRSLILNKLAEFEAGKPDSLDPMLKQIKPIDAPDLSKYTGEQPLKFYVEMPGPKIDPQTQKFPVLVQLPPEYDPYRQYPLLLTLPGARQSAEQNLNMWCGGYSSKLGVRTGHAMRNGYVVMSVDWRRPNQFAYEYTGREHAVILKAMRMALRKFSIDSDRVFLSGHGIGGNAVYDIGVSHPEHWAGLISVTGKMDKYVDIYAKNNEHIAVPYYAVVGEKDFSTVGANKDIWNKWLSQDDLTVVMYKGRANELFPEEIPDMFKWMRAQRRRTPDKSGFKFECKSLRPWDNYFWFFEFHGIPVEETVWPADYRSKNIPRRMVISGETKPDNPNAFRLGPSTSKIENDSTLWLSPEFVDFNKQITIGGRGRDFKGFAKPSSEVLLEDIRRRADREHPYWGRIDCRNNVWSTDK